MSDLRAKVEALRQSESLAVTYPPADSYNRALDTVLALIPEGAVLVTEETLAAALDSVEKGIASRHPEATVVSQRKAAAILAKLR